jgi:putative heme iron utilization protein
LAAKRAAGVTTFLAVNDSSVASSSSDEKEDPRGAEWGPIGSNEAIKSYTPSAAEDARTAVSLVRHGTFCTLSSDTGTPFGTHVHYLVDETTGSPIIRVPADSVEDLNLLKDGKCSLYIHPSGDATDAVARVTLMGKAVHVGRGAESHVAEVREDFATLSDNLPASARSFEDLVHDHDEVFRLDVDKVYVRRLACVITQEKQMEVVDSADYESASSDPLAFIAPFMVEKWNKEHLEDIVRFCYYLTGVPLEELESAKLLWIDSLGLYIRYQKFNEHPKDVRMGFPQPVDNEKALVSTLTMLGQVTWENQK